jgi:phosphoribosylaminoimidazole-succinocarboxamide synthase
MLPTKKRILESVPNALLSFNMPGLGKRVQGRTRDSFILSDGRRVSVVTDRIGHWDQIYGAVPYKGQVLNQLAAFWFEHTDDIVPNSMLAVPDPNVMVTRHLERIPVEVVVRGYITGTTPTSLWYSYDRGEHVIYGIRFPEGLQKNDALLKPIITPIIRTGPGIQGEMLSAQAVTQRGLVEPDLWEQICDTALKLFDRGQQVAEKAGLIMVDALYEFGVDEKGTIRLINELHTPDAARFWLANSYASHKAAGKEPEHLDNEFIYLWYDGQGYEGQGTPPAMPQDLTYEASRRYIQVYEYLTREEFMPADYPAERRIRAVLKPFKA